MGTERVTVYAKIGRTVIRFQGAKWFYGDSDIRAKTGIKTLDEGALDDGDVPITGAQGKQYLVRLVAVLKSSVQSDKSYRFQFYCDPSFVEEAITGLLKKKVDESLLPGSYSIVSVYRKLEISRA
jgi:hypothetical protein